MLEAITIVLTFFGLLAVGISGFFLLECTAALFPIRRSRTSANDQPLGPVAVVVPAHNEASSVAKTVRGILAQLKTGDRLVVVADNCSDSTASIAAALGTETLVRNNQEYRGKGYAIQFAIDHLSIDPPATVVIVDADCDLATGSIQSLAGEVRRTDSPAQARNAIIISETAGLFERVSAFAFVTKNFVRPSGLAVLNGPCLLTGTGMAFPWRLAAATNWANGNIAEDMDLSARLAAQGSFARYVPTAFVSSLSAPTRADSMTQRTRWEHGHLQTIGRSIPAVAGQFIKAPTWRLFLLACEICIPPISLLAMGLGVLLALSALWAFAMHEMLPLFLAAGSCSALLSGALIAWWIGGRSLISISQLLYVPLYALTKVPLYFAFLVKPQRDWIRTGRVGDAVITAQKPIPAPHILHPAESTTTHGGR